MKQQHMYGHCVHILHTLVFSTRTLLPYLLPGGFVMGFTIEDMLIISRDKYEMERIAGVNGWSNSISWILQIEDSTILHNFKGKELAVTTGLGFDTEEKLLDLAGKLVQQNASGLVINTGKYVLTVPQSLIRFCDANDFPLLTVPWSIYLLDMIKDLSVSIFLQSAADEQISSALIRAIEEPSAAEQYKKDLLPYFDTDGDFQIALITTGDLDIMDTVERRRLSYQMHIYMENITHNGSFFYYDSCFALVINALTQEQVRDIVDGFVNRIRLRLPNRQFYVGVSSMLPDLSNLHLCYQRAHAAMNMAIRMEKSLVYFDEMGLYRLLTSVQDKKLLVELGPEKLRPIIEYDRRHNTGYLETLECYLRHNGSIQAVAEELFTHRNTVIYRVNNIKKLLGTSLDTSEERIAYSIACMLVHI